MNKTVWSMNISTQCEQDDHASCQDATHPNVGCGCLCHAAPSEEEAHKILKKQFEEEYSDFLEAEKVLVAQGKAITVQNFANYFEGWPNLEYCERYMEERIRYGSTQAEQ